MSRAGPSAAAPVSLSLGAQHRVIPTEQKHTSSCFSNNYLYRGCSCKKKTLGSPLGTPLPPFLLHLCSPLKTEVSLLISGWDGHRRTLIVTSVSLKSPVPLEICQVILQYSATLTCLMPTKIQSLQEDQLPETSLGPEASSYQQPSLC